MKRWFSSVSAILLLAAAALFFWHPAARREAPSPVPRGKPMPGRERPGPAVLPPIKARVAIVIDDFGYQPALDGRILAMTVPFTAAVIPNRPHTRESAAMAKARGHEVIVHLPMAPRIASAGEPDALAPGMSAAAIARRLGQVLDGLPEAVGVNNHQGSGATEDAGVMEAVLATLRERNLFFLDSLTTDRSVAAGVARRLGVPYVRRDVFLDNVKEELAIRRQVDELVRIALRRGSAVAIGHVHPVTALVLRKETPGLRKKGIQVVPLSRLVQP